MAIAPITSSAQTSIVISAATRVAVLLSDLARRKMVAASAIPTNAIARNSAVLMWPLPSEVYAIGTIWIATAT